MRKQNLQVQFILSSSIYIASTIPDANFRLNLLFSTLLVCLLTQFLAPCR
eukprot:m.34900 g.34900  ORF g.34900 m.34900 type:complete len:50 (-) comp17053_c0_seq1:799-948(-)